MTCPRRFTFPRSHRLSGRRAFAQVFDARMRKPLGPLVFLVRPNQRGHNRLGLSVGRSAGNAVQRHRIKRLLREAFRLEQHDLPQGYDVVILVRPHAALKLEDYRSLLVRGLTALDALARRRDRRGDPSPAREELS